jgi:hypothetical protein
LTDGRFHPEWMTEPTQDSPVPSLQQMSNTALKKVFIGMYNVS